MKILLFFFSLTSMIYSQAKTNVSIIKNIEIGETVIIKYQSNGCFGSSKSSLTLTKTEENFLLVYQKKEYHLSDKEFNILVKFEHKLHYICQGGCTTIDDYEILNKNTSEFFMLNDITCSWYGFNKLIEKLKFKKTT